MKAPLGLTSRRSEPADGLNPFEAASRRGSQAAVLNSLLLHSPFSRGCNRYQSSHFAQRLPIDTQVLTPYLEWKIASCRHTEKTIPYT